MLELKDFLFEVYNNEDSEYVLDQYGGFESFEKELFQNISDQLKSDVPGWDIKFETGYQIPALVIKSNNKNIITSFKILPRNEDEDILVFSVISFVNKRGIDQTIEDEETTKISSMDHAIKVSINLIKKTREILSQKYSVLDEATNTGLMIGDQEQSVTGAPNFTKLQMWGNAQGALPREDNPKMSIKRRLFGSNQDSNDEVNPSLQKNESSSIKKTEKHPYGDPIEIIDNITSQIYGIFENDELDEEWELDEEFKIDYTPRGFNKLFYFETVNEPIIHLSLFVSFNDRDKKFSFKYLFLYKENMKIKSGGIGFIKLESFEEGLIPQDILQRLIGSMNQKFQELMEKLQASLNETFKSKAQQRYFYSKAKKSKKWKKMAGEFSPSTNYSKLPNKTKKD